MRQSHHVRFTMVLLLAIVIALFVIFVSRPTAGQGFPSLPPDAGNGRRVASMMCVGCHLVGPDAQTPAVAGVPSFAAIANHAGQTPEKLAAALIIPHPPMPTISLTNTEMRDIIAYILTFRTAK